MPSLPQIPLSRKVHGVNAVGAPAETHGTQAWSPAGPSAACRAPGANHLVSMSLTRPLIRPRRARGTRSAPALRLTLCCGVERRAQLHLTERSIPGAVTRDHRSHSWSCCGTWDFAHPGARRLTLIKATLQRIRGGRELNEQSEVLPCVFTGSDVSATPQRLWPGAQWTIAEQGPRESVWCTAYNMRKPRHKGRQGERTKRPPMPSPLDLRRGQGRLRTSGCPSSRTRGIPVNCNTRRQKTAIRGRRPSLPETNSMAGRTCVRNVVEKDKSPRVATTQ